MKNSCFLIASEDNHEITVVSLVIAWEDSLTNKVKTFQFTSDFETKDR